MIWVRSISKVTSEKQRRSVTHPSCWVRGCSAPGGRPPPAPRPGCGHDAAWCPRPPCSARWSPAPRPCWSDTWIRGRRGEGQTTQSHTTIRNDTTKTMSKGWTCCSLNCKCKHVASLHHCTSLPVEANSRTLTLTEKSSVDLSWRSLDMQMNLHQWIKVPTKNNSVLNTPSAFSTFCCK